MNVANWDWKLIAAIFFGFTSIIQFIIKYRADKKHPQKIICRQNGYADLVRIASAALKEVRISYDGRPVDRLTYLEIDVSNFGNDIIRNPSIRFKFPDDTTILNCSAKVEPEQTQEFKLEFKEVKHNETEIAFPYLNPQRQHKQRITLKFVCDGPVDRVTPIGGGEGWSVEYAMPIQRRVRQYDGTEWIVICAMIATSSGYAVGAIGSYMDFSKTFNLPVPLNPILRELAMPLILLIFASPYLLYKRATREWTVTNEGEHNYRYKLSKLKQTNSTSWRTPSENVLMMMQEIQKKEKSG